MIEVPFLKQDGHVNISIDLPRCVQEFQQLIDSKLFQILHQQFPKLVKLNIQTQVSKAQGYDFSWACYSLAPVLALKPDEVARIIVDEINKSPNTIFEKVEQGGGVKEKAFVHFTINSQVLASAIIGEFLLSHKRKSKDESIVIEFSSPNTNKPLHVGHVRNNCIGDSITRILKHEGYNVTKINLINDRGIHICKSMLAYKKFGKNKNPKTTGTKGDHFVGKYYVKFEKELEKEYKEWLNSTKAQEEFQNWKNSTLGKRIIEKNEKDRKKIERQTPVPTDLPDDFKSFKSNFKDYYTNNYSILGKECNDMLVKWEEGDDEIRQLWSMMNEWVFMGFKETYQLFCVTHDVWERESDIYKYGKDIIQDAYKAGMLEKLENGSIACDLVNIGVVKKGSGESNKKVLIRANGTSVYMTQDIGTAIRRLDLYTNPKPSKFIYVVASEQALHFETLFKIIEKLRPDSLHKWKHMSYGMVMLLSKDIPKNYSEGISEEQTKPKKIEKMSSREGTVVNADTLLDELKDKAIKIVKNKWQELSENEASDRATKIALAAVKFFMLSVGPSTMIKFDQDASLEFNGKSGPYLLYQYARTRSILRKSGVDPSDINFDQDCLSKFGTIEEHGLLCSLYQFPKDIQFACETQDPSKICDSIYNIAQYFSIWYKVKDNRIVHCKDSVLKKARLLLLLATSQALKTGLNLLGIETLEQM